MRSGRKRRAGGEQPNSASGDAGSSPARRTLPSLLRYKFLHEYGCDKGEVVEDIVADIRNVVRNYFVTLRRPSSHRNRLGSRRRVEHGRCFRLPACNGGRPKEGSDSGRQCDPNLAGIIFAGVELVWLIVDAG